jgi:hypothetical protein
MKCTSQLDKWEIEDVKKERKKERKKTHKMYITSNLPALGAQ